MPIRKYLNVGTVANDGKGDTLRDAADKIEYNFNVLFNRLDVVTKGTTGNITSEEQLIFFNNLSPISMTLEDGEEAGDRKELVNTQSSTVTITGDYLQGSTLSLASYSACHLVWTGTSWAIFDESGVSIT